MKRVLKPGGVLAVWSYTMADTVPEITAVVAKFARDILDGYWAPEVVAHTDAYTDDNFPFATVDYTPPRMYKTWSQSDYLNYLRTWSAYRSYVRANGTDPIQLIEAEFADAWGDRDTLVVEWELLMRVGRV